jgi:hypothetical protein
MLAGFGANRVEPMQNRRRLAEKHLKTGTGEKKQTDLRE